MFLNPDILSFVGGCRLVLIQSIGSKPVDISLCKNHGDAKGLAMTFEIPPVPLTIAFHGFDTSS